MELIAYFLVFLAICVVWFLITRLWAAGIDIIVAGIKKIFNLDTGKPARDWHTLEDIRNKNNQK